MQRLGSSQYQAALAMPRARKGISQNKIYDELGLETLSPFSSMMFTITTCFRRFGVALINMQTVVAQIVGYSGVISLLSCVPLHL